MRYLDLRGPVSINATHEISVNEMDHPIASRVISYDLTLARGSSAEAVPVTIDQAKLTFTAHGQKQRLGTRHIKGRTFELSIGDDGRSLAHPEAGDALVVDLGMQAQYSIATELAGLMPTLPEKAPSVGFTWTTEQPIGSVEGWSRTTGQLASRHRITAIDQQGSHTIVTVTTEAQAGLKNVEGGAEYEGGLTRNLQWTFDATAGRLLTVTVDQESRGDTVLPQGGMSIRQSTHIELAPAEVDDSETRP